MTWLGIAQVGSLLLTLFAIAPAVVSLPELPTKLRLAGPEYVEMHQVYQQWGFSRLLRGVAMVFTCVLGALVYKDATAFLFVAIAIALTSATQAVFWGFTFPVERATRDWTELPGNWSGLRDQWEYARATNAAFGLGALVALVVSVLVP